MLDFPRITIDAEKMAGTPCIRGLRIAVATIVSMTSEGMAESDILAAYPHLKPEDIREALRFPAR